MKIAPEEKRGKQAQTNNSANAKVYSIAFRKTSCLARDAEQNRSAAVNPLFPLTFDYHCNYWYNYPMSMVLTFPHFSHRKLLSQQQKALQLQIPIALINFPLKRATSGMPFPNRKRILWKGPVPPRKT